MKDTVHGDDTREQPCVRGFRVRAKRERFGRTFEDFLPAGLLAAMVPCWDNSCTQGEYFTLASPQWAYETRAMQPEQIPDSAHRTAEAGTFTCESHVEYQHWQRNKDLVK